MYEYKGVKITWLGHDGFRIQNGQVVYIDPFQIESGRPKADLLLISHEHFDHCNPDDLKKVVTPNTVVVAHAQSKDELSKVKVKEVKIIKPGDKIKIGDVNVEAVPAYNVNKFREPGKAFHPKEDGKLGFVVTVKGVRIYHTGDSDHIPEMRGLRPDIALVPVSGTYVMTSQEAVEAVASIDPKVAIPMHYGAIVGDQRDADAFKKQLKCEVQVLAKER
ncbi:MAG TPA: MBL fold metallo-hydrolase [Terriglobales bacterium]|nr:MBL fold metallo-hydrolase [Terriglobales bacterium]